MISILINYLNKELGCDCSCKNTINNTKKDNGGYF